MFFKGRDLFDCAYSLYLRSDSVPAEPFDLSVLVIVGTNTVSSTRTTYSSTKQIIWRERTARISKVVPDFDERELLFQIIVHGNAATGHTRGMTADKLVQTPTYLDPKFELENLSQDLAKLLHDDDWRQRDVELVCGDRTWKAHGILLSARSDVFKAMLQGNMIESKTGRVDIQDTQADIFQWFLQYLYSGRLPELTVEAATQLYEIGDRYSVAGIKQRCASFLEDNLTKDNACTVLSLADQHSDQQLKQCAISFVLKEKILLQPEYWSDFCKARPMLAIEIYDQFLKINLPK